MKEFYHKYEKYFKVQNIRLSVLDRSKRGGGLNAESRISYKAAEKRTYSRRDYRHIPKAETHHKSDLAKKINMPRSTFNVKVSKNQGEMKLEVLWGILDVLEVPAEERAKILL